MRFSWIIYTITFTLGFLSSNAQEVLLNLSSYPIPKTDKKNTSSKSKSVLELPFFDDFSRNSVIPTSDLWEKSSVTVNQNYAINPPTIGIVTFDAIDNSGEIISTLTTTAQGADTLTSLPINLNLLPSDSIYLSFSFQPKGLGYEPSSRDSLVLEFWDNLQAQWERVWSSSVNFADNTILFKNLLTSTSKTSMSGLLNQTFFNAIINIGENRFLTSNFKFRFINYASLSSNQLVPGLKSNSDHWHLDMVYLNQNRNFEDTLYNDIAFSSPIQNLMKNYTSLPWSHFSNAFEPEFTDTVKFSINYHNLGPTIWNVSRRFKVVDISGLQDDYAFSGGAENITPYQDFSYTRLFDYAFNSAWADSAKFWLQSYLITDIFEETKHLRYNDTISSTVEFNNYYSLDDGSSESGYGLFGEGTEDGMVAFKFHNYKEDNLKGVMIYFNRTYQDANQVINGDQIAFNLSVWNNDNGKPGDIIYQKNNVRPLFTDSLNKFTFYRIDPTLIPEGDFFLGWVQTSQDMLNVGFDMNINNQSKLFYNISGNWVNTQFEGSLMIRPIFGNMYQTPTNIVTNTNEPIVTLYPNPVNNFISISSSDDFTISTVQIINSTGNIVLNRAYTIQESINIQNLPTGLYFVRIFSKNSKVITRKLLIVQ